MHVKFIDLASEVLRHDGSIRKITENASTTLLFLTTSFRMVDFMIRRNRFVDLVQKADNLYHEMLQLDLKISNDILKSSVGYIKTGYQQQTIGNDQPNKNLFHFFLCMDSLTFQTLNGRPYMDESARHMNIFIHPKIDENANSCVCICLHQILCICIYRLMSRKKGKSKR